MNEGIKYPQIMSDIKIASTDYVDDNFAAKSDLNVKQDQLTSDNAGDNITITGSGSSLKINAERQRYSYGRCKGQGF